MKTSGAIERSTVQISASILPEFEDTVMLFMLELDSGWRLSANVILGQRCKWDMWCELKLRSEDESSLKQRIAREAMR